MIGKQKFKFPSLLTGLNIALNFAHRFDAAYDVEAPQEAIFIDEVEPVLPSLFEGLNTTIFCYGMTGAGKTFTMQGPPNNPGSLLLSFELKLTPQKVSSLAL